MSYYQRAYWVLKQINYYRRHPVEFAIVSLVWLIGAFGKFMWWTCKSPPRLGTMVVTVAAGAQWGLKTTPVALGVSVIVFTMVWIALVAERGTARGLSAILTGVMRLVRMRRLWPSVCMATGFTTADGYPVPAKDWRISQHGLTLTLAVGSTGKPEVEAIKYAESIRSNMYVDRVRMRKVAPGVMRLWIEFGDHLRQFRSLADIPPATRQGYLAVGVREDGTVLELPIGKSVLAVGLTGAGKSSFAWALVYALIRAGIPFRLTICDPKFVEWKIAKESIDASPIVYRYTDSPADMGERGLRQGGFMWQIDQELTEKLKHIPAGQRVATPTEESPLDIIIVDETLPLTKELKKHPNDHPLARVTYMGRAANEWVIFCSQTGEKDVIGPIRDLVPVRMAFALPSREQAEMALGSGAVNRGAMPHLLDPTEDAGICYVATDTGDMTAARIGFATDREIPYLIMGEMPPEQIALPDKYSLDRPCFVYRYYGLDDNGVKELKYVGESYDWVERYKQHERREPEMMAECVMEWTEVEQWPSKASAEVEEARQIKRLKPKWNTQHNGRNRRVTIPSAEEDEFPW